jgi:hemoglobin
MRGDRRTLRLHRTRHETTHAGLGITEKDWDSSVKDLVATLDKFNVPPKEKDEVLAAVSGLKKDIVEKP